MAKIDEDVREILERTRRIETRTTKFMEAQGFDTKVQRATFEDGCVHIPSTNIAIRDILAVIPADHLSVAYAVIHDGKVLGYVSLS